jgi:sigma-B regulation protein RsbU (phosphoserine phosphatase)
MNDTELVGHLMELLPDAIFVKDDRCRFVRINKVFATWYGLKDAAEVVGKSDADFLPQGYARANEEAELAILRKGIPVLGQEEKVVGGDGKTRWVSTTKLPLRNGKGAIVGILGFSRDIRHEKRVEEMARDSEALYQSLIESLPQCIFRKDVEGKYVYVNQRLCALFGITAKNFLGKTDFDVNPAALATKYRRDDQWVMAHQKVFEAIEFVKAKRKKIKIRIYKTPVYDSKGSVVGVQGVFSAI